MTTNEYTAKETEFSGHYSRVLYETLWWGWRRWKTTVWLMVLCGVLGRFALLSVSLVFGMWADSLCWQSGYCGIAKSPPGPLSAWSSEQFITLLGLLVGGGVFLSGLFLILVAVTGTKVSQLIHSEAMLRISRSPMPFFDRNPVGRIFSRFSSDFQQFQMANGPHLGQLAIICLDLLLMIFLISLANILFLPAVLATLAVNWYIYRANKYPIREQRRLAAAARSPSIAHFASTVQGYLPIRVFLRERRFAEVFTEKLNDFLAQRVRAEMTFHLFGFQLSAVTAGLVLASAVMGLALVHWELASVGELGVVLTYVTMSSNFVQRMFTLVTGQEQGMAGLERINQYIHQPIEPHAQLPRERIFPTQHAVQDQEVLAADRGDGRELTVENLSFSYGRGLPLVLNDVSFTVPAGGELGIVGRTGAGKSSLFQVLLHLYPMSKGRLLLDRIPLQVGADAQAIPSFALTEWRRCFAYIAQEPAVFRGSLRHNLVPPGWPGSDRELHAILAQVGLEDWFTSLPGGLDAPIAEGGANMSAGQKQLLAIARCLLKKASIVLMDEATSAVDPATEAHLSYAVKELLRAKTRLIIAHRLSTVAQCTQVLWLEHGRVRKLGDAKEVLREFQGEPTSRSAETSPMDIAH